MTVSVVARVLILGLSAGLGVCVLTQSFHGGVRGRVQDAAGGLIPGVEVTLLDERAGVSRRAVSNEAGEYSFANLQPSEYTLRAEVQGFKTYVSEQLPVGISTSLVVDLEMELGAVDEVVTVTEAAPLVENGTASVASTIDRAEIETLPSPGRNIFIMAVTTPNVVHTGNPVWVKQSDQTNSSLLSLGGGPLRGNNYTVDGVSVTDLRNRAVIIPAFEAIQEMKVQVNTYDAEMGRTGGGVFNTIHRSGTNDLAGSALVQFRPGQRNTFLRKLNYFEQQDYEAGARSQFPDAPYRLFGGAFGGPITKNRTFFWTAMEGYSDKLVQTQSVHVPSAAQASGDFSQAGTTVFSPFDLDAGGNRRPFPNSRIPASLIDGTGAGLSQSLASLGPGGFLSASGSQTVTAVQSTGNLNHSVTDGWRLSGTYLYYTSQEPEFSYYRGLLGADESPEFEIGQNLLQRDVHALAINNTFVPSAVSVLTLRYGQTYFNDSWTAPEYGKEAVRSQLGIDGEFLDAIYAQPGYMGQFPAVHVAGFGRNGLTHGSVVSNNIVEWYSREVSGTYARYTGNHTVKYGAQWRRLGLHSVGFGNGFRLGFARRFTQGPDPARPDTGSGSGLADLLLGIPDGGSATLAAPANVYLDYFGGFFQDDWRVTPRLVLNLGMRVERESGLREDSDEFTVGWERKAEFPEQVDPGPGLEGTLPGFPLRGGLMYAGVDGNRTHQWDPPRAKLGPRIGFAYSLAANTVIRGGFAVFWAPYAIPSGTGASHLGTYGYTAVTNLARSVDGITPPEATASRPFPRGIQSPVGNSNGRFQNVGGDVYFNEQFRESPVIYKWSVDLQRRLARDIALKAGYLSSRGVDLPIGGTNNSRVNINQLADAYIPLGDRLNESHPNPFYGRSAFGSFAAVPTLPLGQLLRPFPHFRNVYARHVSAGKSQYHSLRLELEKRFQKHWGTRVNYTLTHHKDNIYEANTLLQSVSGVTDTIYNTPDGCAYGRCPVMEEDYSWSNLHVPQQLNLNFIWAPAIRGRWLLGGWTASMATVLRSGFPLAVTQNENPLSAFGFGYQRPETAEVSGGGDPDGNTVAYISSGAVRPTSGLQISSAPRTTASARSPVLVNWDIAFQKTIQLSERASLLLRLEFINMFNNVNWNGPLTVFGLDNFGSISGVRGFPRTFQLMTKVVF